MTDSLSTIVFVTAGINSLESWVTEFTRNYKNLTDQYQKNELYLSSQRICVFRMILTINSDCFPNSINRLGFVAES
jgi:hypothetical protein